MMVSLKIKSVLEGKGTPKTERQEGTPTGRLLIQPKEEELYVQTQMAVEVYGQKAASFCDRHDFIRRHIIYADY